MDIAQIRIVMVQTSHPGNIGSAARAMKTMGIRELVLVAPKSFPHDEANALAAGADDILQFARVVLSLDEAIADCDLVFGLTARSRTVSLPELDPRAATERASAATRVRFDSIVGVTSESKLATQSRVAFLFGNERTGLLNEDLSKCHFAVHIPSNAEYSSLNVAAAVQIICYEWRRAQIENISAKEIKISEDSPQLATMSELEGFFTHLEQTLERIDFFKGRPSITIMQRLRRLYLRAELGSREVMILRGILAEADRMAKLAQAKNE